MKRITLIISLIILAFSSAVSCLDTTDMEARLDKIEEKIAALEEAVIDAYHVQLVASEHDEVNEDNTVII